MASWFETWFDTKYYHQLYNNRDEKEASFFIDNIVNELALDANARILDLCCGKGRHAIQLNQMGFDVVGVDLSGQSIAQAKKFEQENLRFFVHDMRNPMPGEQFDAVFNLFTSFGYFENLADNLKVLESIHSYLNKDGILFIDFMNVNVVIKNMVPVEQKERDGILFDIQKYVEDNQIVKRISFSDNGKKHEYFEKVQAIDYQEFIRLLETANFKVEQTFGNYSLQPYDQLSSERLILQARKIS